MKDLVGKTAFVTGAASGIGSGIAAALAQAGVKVMLCDIEEAPLTKAVVGDFDRFALYTFSNIVSVYAGLD
jgi:NAD(P)-dependent dehydrogenase (short-subunit alcohol dehydrogenase family)